VVQVELISLVAFYTQLEELLRLRHLPGYSDLALGDPRPEPSNDALIFGIATSIVAPLLIVANMSAYLVVTYCGWTGATTQQSFLLSVFNVMCAVLEVFLAVTALGVAVNFTFVVFGLSSSTTAVLGTCPSGPFTEEECGAIVTFGIVGYLVLLSRVVIILLCLYWGVPLAHLADEHLPHRGKKLKEALLNGAQARWM
jgi:hypothetical protein